MTRENDAAHISPLSFELWVLGELRGVALDVATGHVLVCGACRDYHDSLLRSVGEFQQSVHDRTAARVADALMRREAGRGARRFTWRMTALAAGVLAMLVLAVRLTPRTESRDATRPGVLQKGSPGFMVYASRGNGVSRLADGAQLAPGDRLRFATDQGDYPYLLIASVDGGGQASVYVPYGGRESLRLTPQQHFIDDGSIVLDESLGPERIVAFFSHRALQATDVVRRMQELGRAGPETIRRAGQIGVGDVESSLLIEKRGDGAR